MSKQIVIGITGGIGSGKSVVSKILSVYGVPVFDCDREAKLLYETSQELRAYVIRRFGEELYATEDNRLDRARLASIVFSDSQALAELEGGVHPLLRTRFSSWCRSQSASIVALESAILFQSGYSELCSIVAYVEAPLEERIARVIRRDNTTASAVEARLRCQTAPSFDDFPIPIFTINNASGQALLPKVRLLLQSLS